MKKNKLKLMAWLGLFALANDSGYAADILNKECLSPAIQIQSLDLRDSNLWYLGQGRNLPLEPEIKNRVQAISHDFKSGPEYAAFLARKDKLDSPEAVLRQAIFADRRILAAWFDPDINLNQRLDLLNDKKIAAAFNEDIFALKRTAVNVHFQDRYAFAQARLVTEKEQIVYPKEKTRRVLFPLGQNGADNIAFTLCQEIDAILAKNPRLVKTLSFLQKTQEISLVIAADFELEDEEDALAFVHHAEPENKKEIIFSGIKLAGEKIFIKNSRIDFQDKIILREDGMDITLLAKVLGHEAAHLFLAQDFRFLLPLTAAAEKKLEQIYFQKFGMEMARTKSPDYKVIEIMNAFWLERRLGLIRAYGERSEYLPEQIQEYFISAQSFDSAEEFFADYLGLFLLDPEYVREKDPETCGLFEALADWDRILIPKDAAQAIQRRARIAELSREMDKEEKNPGSGILPQIVVMSDFHGEIELFFRYLEDALSRRLGQKIRLDPRYFPQVSIQEQLEAQHVGLAELYNLNLRFHCLGDFSDRGKYGIKCFLATEELKKLGLARVVTGNHDFLQMMAAMGYHLPIYEGYEFYGYELSRKLVEEHWHDPEITQDRFAWWSQKLVEYNQAQKKFQKEFLLVRGTEKDINDIREELKKTYLNIRNELSDEERRLWQELSGFYFETTDVYTGFNAIGKMSLDWWQDKLEQAEMFLEMAEKRARWRGEKQSWSHELIIWKELFEYVQAAESAVRQKFQQARVVEGKWWYQVFNDINHQNYESPEWYAQDWIFHSGWGTSVIAELNELDLNLGAEWTAANFMHNKHIQDFAKFSRDNFTLFVKDEYGNYYSHGWLPVDMASGEIRFKYQGVDYAGERVWAGLEKIQADIRDQGKPWSELKEAFALIMFWYADKTTRIKPAHIQTIVNKVGLAKVQARINARTWFTCHNPLNTLQPKGIGFKMQEKQFLHFSVDKGMSWQKFKDVGGYVLVDQGVKLRGYDDPSFARIVDSPQTLTLKRSPDGKWDVIQNWDNPGLDQAGFFRQMRQQLTAESRTLAQPRQKTSADIHVKAAKISLIKEASMGELIESGI